MGCIVYCVMSANMSCGLCMWGMSWYANTGFSARCLGCPLATTDQFHIRKLAYVPLYWILDIGTTGDDCIVNYAWSLWPFYRHSSVIILVNQQFFNDSLHRVSCKKALSTYRRQLKDCFYETAYKLSSPNSKHKVFFLESKELDFGWQ